MPTDSNQSETQSIMSTLNKLLQSFKEYSDVDTADIDKQISQLQSNTSAADDANNELLLKQEEVKAIINDEKNRIQTNIDTVENNITTKKRMIEFNESNRLRTEQYNNILYIFVISLSLIVVIIIGFRQISFLPDIISQILVIIVGSVSSIYIFKLYSKINQRSHLDYNKLNLDKPVIDSPEQIKRSKETAAKSGDLLGSITTDGCTGAECCSTGTIWDTDAQQCKIPEGFVTERLKYNHNIVPPNSPNEFNEYSKV